MANQKRSAYAIKYEKDVRVLKSHLTPTKSRFPTRDSTAAERYQRQLDAGIDDYQKEVFHGFTTRELVDLDAISTRQLKPSTLNGGISDLFETFTWEVDAGFFERDELYGYTLPNGTTGLWSGHNPVVWGLLRESFMIASRLLLCKHLLPWLNGLMNGGRFIIPRSRISVADREDWDERLVAFDFLPLKSEVDERMVASQRDALFATLLDTWEYTLGFKTDDENPYGGKNGFAFPPTSSYGNTCYFDWPAPPPNASQIPPENAKRVWTYLAIEHVEALFRDDLDPAERLGMQWFFANTLVHEVMHAIHVPLAAANPTLSWGTGLEAFFQRESVAELGFSMEYNCFGGEPEPFIYKAGLPHLGYWHLVKFPTWTDVKRRTHGIPVLNHPEPLSNQIRCPIPVTFYEDMHNEEFYTVGLRKFGMDVMDARGKGQGASTMIFTGEQGRDNIPTMIRFDVSGNARRVGGPWHNPNLVTALDKMKVTLGMSQNERKIYDFGTKLLKSAEREGEFWEQSLDATKHVDYILQAMEDERNAAQGDAEKIDKLQWEQVDMLTEAVNAHFGAAKALIASETVNSTTFTDRRINMLNWIRGTRQYNRALSDVDLGRTAAQQLEYQHHFELVAGGLEISRMMFWVPTILDRPSKDENNEYFLLGAAWSAASTNNDMITLRNICNNVLRDVGSTWFATCLAEALKMATLQDADFSQHAQDVRRIGRRGIQRLNKMRGFLTEDGHHPEWRTIFKMWLDIVDPDHVAKVGTISSIGKRKRYDDDDDDGDDGPALKMARNDQDIPMDMN